MVDYYIYHIVGIKVGCTISIPDRGMVLGKNDLRYKRKIVVLEVIRRRLDNEKSWEVVGKREAYWKYNLGYALDNNTYHMSRSKLRLAGERGVQAGAPAKGGKANGKSPNNVFIGNTKLAKSGPAAQYKNGTHINQLGMSGFQQIVDCPHCPKSGRLAAMKRWHFDNCKEK